MGNDRRRVRLLIVAVFIPLVILIGVLASAVLGDFRDAPVLDATPAPETVPAPPGPATTPAPAGPPHHPGAQPAPAPPAATGFVPAGAERIDVGSGARGAAIFRPPGTAGRPGPVVIFVHGWVAIDPRRYGGWIGHLVRGGATVIYPAYQTKPAYDTIAPLADLLAGVRAALQQVHVAPGRLVVAGHSVGGALAADYAATAAQHGLPSPAAVLAVYPGRKLRHLATPVPSVDLAAIAPRTRLVVLAGERDTAVGSETAQRIAAEATRADVTVRTVRDDAVDEHSAPRRTNQAARQTFWRTLDDLVASTAPAASPASPRSSS
ncbi:MAG: alpha/beta hydrolase [Solirubrobacteraceae bacterium]|nr:alpha/beta hydrolase [Solirubrobacteraceae bacterium]